jgi:hypothetical protein
MLRNHANVSDYMQTTLLGIILHSEVCRISLVFGRIVEQAVLTFRVRFSVSKALSALENRILPHYIVSIDLMDEL